MCRLFSTSSKISGGGRFAGSDASDPGAVSSGVHRISNPSGSSIVSPSLVADALELLCLGCSGSSALGGSVFGGSGSLEGAPPGERFKSNDVSSKALLCAFANNSACCGDVGGVKSEDGERFPRVLGREGDPVLLVRREDAARGLAFVLLRNNRDLRRSAEDRIQSEKA